MPLKITLDPGHGRNDNRSPNYPTYVEGTQMWHLAVYLEKALERYGFDVVTTRPNIDENPTLEERGQIAGENTSCLMLSLHSNSPAKREDGTYDPKVTGTVAFYPLSTPEIKKLADALGERVSAMMDHYFRGSQTKSYPNSPKLDYYGVIRNALAYGCRNAIILEHGFHTNPSDAQYLLDDVKLKALAEAEAEIIAEYFGLKKQSTVVSDVVKLDNEPQGWSKEAVDWAVKNKILNGDENGNLKLREPCTREELITILYRALGKEN